MAATLHTSLGDIKVELFCDRAPQSCEVRCDMRLNEQRREEVEERCVLPSARSPSSGLGLDPRRQSLSASGYYDNTVFHRNIKGFLMGCYVPRAYVHETGFMIQGGDPTGTGKGGESIFGKTFPDEIKDDLKFSARGMLGVANKGPDTNGSQFFISYTKLPHLNMKYPLFGNVRRVISGWETLDAMEKVPVGAKDRPVEEIKLKVSQTQASSVYVTRFVQSVTIHANPIADAAIQ
eukprot:181563-Hanusia_phi.AAC.2